MRTFYNYIHLLTLSLLTVFINTSWTADIKVNEGLLRDIIQNNDQHGKTPRSGILKQVDQRISDIIAENVLHFGHNLGLELAALDPDATRSEIFSPLSLIAALSLLTLGAKGRSYQELKQILGLDSDNEIIYNPNKYHEEFGLMLNDLQHTNVNSGGVNKRPNASWRYTKHKMSPVIRSSNRTTTPTEHIIKVANGLFVQSGYTLNSDYSQVLRSIYQTELTELDFQTRNIESSDYINAWINNATFGKIPKIIKDHVDKSTNVILASAVYFKAFWETTFFFRATKEDDFYPDGVNNPPIKVQMMPTGGIFPFYDAKEYDCRIIGLPYKGNETTMYVIQPNNSSRQRLRDLQRVLDAHKINGMIDNMERKTTLMVFPKMRFTRSMHMKKLLQTMSVHDIFVNGYSDLSLIGQRPLTNYAATATAPQGQFFVQNPPLPQSAQETVATESVPVSFESIDRKKPMYQTPQFIDRYDEPPLIFTSRFGEINDLCNNTKNCTNIDTINSEEPLHLTKEPSSTIPTQSSNKREKRQVYNYSPDPVSLALSNLEYNRQKADSYRADLYVDDILHNVDFSVDEQGTEAAAATLTYLHRSGTDVVFRGDTPFLIVIRHDPTKLPLFYAIINKPEL